MILASSKFGPTETPCNSLEKLRALIYGPPWPKIIGYQYEFHEFSGFQKPGVKLISLEKFPGNFGNGNSQHDGTNFSVLR